MSHTQPLMLQLSKLYHVNNFGSLFSGSREFSVPVCKLETEKTCGGRKRAVLLHHQMLGLQEDHRFNAPHANSEPGFSIKRSSVHSSEGD